MTERVILADDPLEVQVSERAEQEASLRQTMAEIVPMFDMEPEAGRDSFSTFVDRRIEELSSLPGDDNLDVSDPSKKIGLFYGGSDAFLPSDVEMVSTALTSRPYYLDDPNAYKQVFDSLSALYKEASRPDRDAQSVFFSAAVSATNVEQANYFGSTYGDEAGRQAVLEDIIDFSDSEEARRISIADLKGVAMCQERAGVAHNTLQILGFTSSKFVSGFLRDAHEHETIMEESEEKGGGSTGTEGAHAFVRFTGANGEYIFDPTNPIIVRAENQAVLAIKPAIYKIEDPSSGVQEVGMIDRTVLADGSSVDRVRNVVYGLGTN
jgi:hypothetical protein